MLYLTRLGCKVDLFVFTCINWILHFA